MRNKTPLKLNLETTKGLGLFEIEALTTYTNIYQIIIEHRDLARKKGKNLAILVGEEHRGFGGLFL